MTEWVVLLLAAALVVTSAAAITVLLRPEGWIDAAITWAVVALVNVAGAVTLVGAIGVLRPGPLLAVHAVLAIVPVALLAHRGWPRVNLHAWRHPWAIVKAAPWESTIVGLAGLALGWQLLVALVLPPYAYDALTYHLTTVASWVQTGSLVRSPLSLCCAHYPGNAELLSAWPMVLLGSETLVNTVQVAAAVLGGVAVAGIGRTAGLSRRGAAAAGALFVLTPAVLAQAPTSYIDVVLASLVLAGLHGIGRFAATARTLRLVVPALCAGFLSGIKGIGLLWAAALVLTAVVIAVVHVRRGRLTGSRAARALLGVIGACALFGGWWYVRNTVDTGNPLYPFEVRVGDWSIFRGPLRVQDVLTQPGKGAGSSWPVAVVASWAAELLPWRHGSYDYQQRLGGLGPLWSWLGLLTIPVVIALWRRRSPALAAIAPVFAVLLVQPYRWWARFTLPLAAVGAIAVVLTVQWLWPVIARRSLLLAATGLVLLGAALVLVEVNPASQAKPLPAIQVVELVGRPEQERSIGHLFFPEYRFLDEIPEKATVMVDLEAEPVRFTYPLFGPRLERTVLPGVSGSRPPDSAWVVTSRGRPLDEELAKSRPGGLVSDERGVRVWAPRD
jgi:hypothetical protein